MIALACAVTLSAQRMLTLDECREMALQNNAAIKNSSLMSRAAHETRKEAFTKYFPNISAGGFAFTANNGIINHNFKGSLPIPTIPGIIEGGALPYDIDLNLIKNGVLAGVNLVQPIFLGGEIVNANRLAEVGEAVAELQSRQSADQVRQTVEQYYWQLATLKAKQSTVAEVMHMLSVLENQVQTAVDAGVVLRNDLLEVQLSRSEMETDSIQLANGINVMSSLLAQYIGLGIEPIDIADSVKSSEEVVMDNALYINPADALHSTSDYQLLSQAVRGAEIAKRMAVGANLPKVAVGASYSTNRLEGEWHGIGALFATVIVPISDWWGGSHSIKRSNLNLQMARNELSDASELLQVKMRNSWDDLTTAYRKIGVARKSIEQAAENLRLNNVYYKAGTVTMTDLLKAQTLYRQSHDRYVEAVGAYRVETVKYLIATGR